MEYWKFWYLKVIINSAFQFKACNLYPNPALSHDVLLNLHDTMIHPLAQVWILKVTLNSYLITITTYHLWSFCSCLFNTSTISPAISTSITSSLARLPACLNTCYAHLTDYSFHPCHLPIHPLPRNQKDLFKTQMKSLHSLVKSLHMGSKPRAICQWEFVWFISCFPLQLHILCTHHYSSHINFENSMCLFGTKALHIFLLFKTLFFIPWLKTMYAFRHISKCRFLHEARTCSD